MVANPTKRSTPRLPEGWSSPEVVGDVIDADGMTIERAGVSAVHPSGEEITGSAASVVPAPSGAIETGQRAWFELFERAAVMEAITKQQAWRVLTAEGESHGIHSHAELFPESPEPTRWRYARSNGVALHVTWADACARAHRELVERDRVLGAWYGDLQPRRIDLDLGAAGLDRSSSYEWRAYSFDDDEPSAPHVAGVFGFPASATAPLVYGFSAAGDARHALTDAAREATQLLAFLWGEPISAPSLAVGMVAAPTPGDHLDHYQPHERHGILKSWLDHGHVSRWGSAPNPAHAPICAARSGADARPPSSPTLARVGREPVFADITPLWLAQYGYYVAKAIAPARPLAFGDSPFVSHMSPTLRIHPIP